MKKSIALILALMLMLALCACSGGDKAPESDKGSEDNVTDSSTLTEGGTLNLDEEGTGTVEGEDGAGFSVQVANPMALSSAQEIKSVIGVNVQPPETATDANYFIISGKMADFQFNYANSACGFRAMKTDGFQDISGVYFSKDPIDASDLKNASRLSHIEDGMGVVLWYADGYSYAVSMVGNASESHLDGLYQHFSETVK